MAVDFTRVSMPRDRDRLVRLLVDDDWPFHGRRRLDADAVDSIDFDSSDAESFWIVDAEVVGLLRVFDLGDIGVGAPQFDLRISSPFRGRRYGTKATAWLVEHLLTAYPDLHRVEANTRADNIAMQRALTTAGFTLEGRLRSSWWSDDGSWHDTLVFGLLRTDRPVE